MKKTPVRIRIIYADTDAMGIVFHTNYIRWFEIGRVELFRDMSICCRDMASGGYNLPLTQVYCHYIRSTYFDDLVQIETDIEYLKRASIKFVYQIWNDDHHHLITEGYSVHACTDINGRIIRIPAVITEKIRPHYSLSKERRKRYDPKD